MKIYRKGFPLLLCCVSTVLCGCSSNNTNTVSTPFNSCSIQAFIQADFDLIQKGTVEINACFGVAARDANTTWDDIVYEYHIDYFKLHVYSSPYCNQGTFEQAVETLKNNVCISKDFIVDVSSNSSTKVEEKKYKNKIFNDGEPLKMFCVKQTISIPAEEFEFKGDGAHFYLSCGAFTSEQKLAERYQQEIKEGTIFEYTYKEGTVKFEVEYPFMSYSPVVLE